MKRLKSAQIFWPKMIIFYEGNYKYYVNAPHRSPMLYMYVMLRVFDESIDHYSNIFKMVVKLCLVGILFS